MCVYQVHCVFFGIREVGEWCCLEQALEEAAELRKIMRDVRIKTIGGYTVFVIA